MTLFVKPRSGYLVRHPERDMTPLPADGAKVPRSPYWLRRLRDGDVIECSPPKPAAKTPAHPPRSSKKEA